MADSIADHDFVTRANPVVSSKVAKDIAQTITAVFYRSWLQFQEQYSKNQVTIQLKKMATEMLDAPATEAASNIIDDEPPAEESTINDLVEASTQRRTKELQAQLKRLEAKLNSISKNSPTRRRGRSSTKNPRRPSQPAKPPRTRTNSPSQKGKAGASANGTNDAKPKPRRDRSPRNGKPKRGKSKNKSNKPKNSPRSKSN